MNKKNNKVHHAVYDNKYKEGDTKQNKLEQMEQMEINENKQK